MASWQQYEGQAIDFDGAYGFQCFDLVNRFSVDNGYKQFTGLYASDIFGQQSGNYSWVTNSPTGIPPTNSVVVWNRNYGGGYGHTAIATGTGDTNWFESLDQNYGAPYSRRIKHNYDGVIGWGIPKNQSAPQEGAKVWISQEEYNNLLHGPGGIDDWKIQTYNATVRATNAENLIKDLQSNVADLSKKIDEQQKKIEEISSKGTGNIDSYSIGDLLNAVFRKIFKLK